MNRAGQWLLALLIVFIGVNAVIWPMLQETATQRTADWSTYRRGGQGTAALYAILTRVGIPVGQLRAPMTELPEDCRQLWILQPTEPVGYDELVALRDWVSGGGQLVASWDFFAHTQMTMRDAINKQMGNETTFPLLAGIEPAPPDAGKSGLTGALFGHAGVFASPSPREGMFRDVRTLHFPRGRGVLGYEGWTPLLEAEGQTLVLAAQFGEGWVVFVSDPDLVGNAGIGEADNAVFAANLASLAGGGVYFDEQHHGFTEQPESVVALAQRSSAGAGVGLAAIGLACALLAAARRLGKPVDPIEPPRRSSLEYVRSLASLYERAGARALAIRAIYDAARRRLLGSARTGEAGHAELARLAAPRLGMDPNEVESALIEARAALETGVRTDAEALRIGRALARLLARPRRSGARAESGRSG